jgi:hypothetical protein
MPIPGPPLAGPVQQAELIVELAVTSGNWPASPTWVDVSDRVRSELGEIKIGRGTDDELNAREAGKLDGLMLDNRDGALSIASGGPLAGLAAPNKAIRLRGVYAGVVYPVFQGQQLEPVFDSNGVDSWVTISAVDALSRLQGMFLPQSLFEQQVRNSVPRAWFQLSEKTESGSKHRDLLADAMGNVPGYYVNRFNAKGFLTSPTTLNDLDAKDGGASEQIIDLSETETPFTYEQGPNPGGSDFGASPRQTYPPFFNIFENAWCYALAGSLKKPAGLGSGPGNMADPNRAAGLDAVTQAGFPASKCGGSYTISFSIQFQRGKPLDPCGVFSFFDQTIADYQYKQLVHGCYIDGSNVHASSNLGAYDFGTYPGRLVWVDQHAGWQFVSIKRLDDERAHRVSLRWDAVNGTREIWIDGVLDAPYVATHNGVYESAYLAIGLWRYSAHFAGSNIGGSAAMANFITWNRALTNAELADDYQTAWAPGKGDTSGIRAARVLAALGVPATSYSFDGGNSVCEPTLLRPIAESALDYMRLLEQTEGGPFYADKTNVLAFRNRYGRLTSVPACVLGDRPDEGELPYVSAEPTVDQQRIRNYIEITREGGATQTITDATSIDEWGEQDYTEDQLPLNSDDEALWRAQYLRKLYAQPQNLIREVTIDPGLDDGLWSAMMAVGLDSLILIRKRDNAGAILFEQPALILKVDLTISRKGWQWTLNLDPSSVGEPWLVLDDPVRGVLDGSNLVAW